MSVCPPGYEYLGRDNDGTPLCRKKQDQGGGGFNPGPPPKKPPGGGGGGSQQQGGGGGNQPGGGGGSGGGGGAGGGFFFSDNYGNHYSQNGYQQLVGTYKHLADIFGVTLTPGMMHALAKNGVGQDELRFRLNMVHWVESSKDMREQFQGVLDFYGIKADVSSDKGALAFGTMRSEKQVYQVWQQFAADAAGKMAGFSTQGVGAPASNQDLSLTQGQQSDFIKSLGLSPDQVDINQLEPIYAQAATWALENLPDVRWKGENFQLDKPALLQLAAGRGDVRQKEALTRLINEHQAFDQARSEPISQQTSSGDIVLAGFGGLTG